MLTPGVEGEGSAAMDTVPLQEDPSSGWQDVTPTPGMLASHNSCSTKLTAVKRKEEQ